jgi:hypothetical protein
MTEIINNLLDTCDRETGNKDKIEKIAREEKHSLEMLPEENKEKRTKGILNYFRRKVRVWKTNVLNKNKANLLLLCRTRLKELHIFMNKVKECNDYKEVKQIRKRIERLRKKIF